MCSEYDVFGSWRVRRERELSKLENVGTVPKCSGKAVLN